MDPGDDPTMLLLGLIVYLVAVTAILVEPCAWRAWTSPAAGPPGPLGLRAGLAALAVACSSSRPARRAPRSRRRCGPTRGTTLASS